MNIDLIFSPWNTQLDKQLTSRSPRVDLRFCHVLSSSLAGPRHSEDVRHQLARGPKSFTWQDLSGDGVLCWTLSHYSTACCSSVNRGPQTRQVTRRIFLVLCSTLIEATSAHIPEYIGTIRRIFKVLPDHARFVRTNICEICIDLPRFASKWTSQGGAEHHGVRTYYTIGSIANAYKGITTSRGAAECISMTRCATSEAWSLEIPPSEARWWMMDVNQSHFTSGLHIHFHHNAWIGLSISRLWFWSS